MMQEQWRPVVGYETFYEVSNFGRVRSIDRNFKMTDGRTYRRAGRILAERNSRGYKTVHLCKNGKDQQRSVHRLVAEAFIPNPKGYREVNHKDETRTNNHVDNLEWCDRKYNANYGTAIDRVRKKLCNPVISVDDLGNEVYYPSIKGAAVAHNGTPGNICAALKGYTNTAFGLKWRYAND